MEKNVTEGDEKNLNPIEHIPIELLHEDSSNPNEETEETFNNLVADIQKYGFDEPLQVAPCECENIKGAHYKIVGGAHRFKAGQVLGFSTIPCVVYQLDEDEQRLYMVRRNLLSGNLNDAKFTELVHSLDERYSRQHLVGAFGFDSEEEFQSHLVEDKESRDKSWLDQMMNESNQEVSMLDGMSDILNNIFTQYGEDVPYNFIFFCYKGKTHLMVNMDNSLKKETDRMVKVLRENELNINDYLTLVLQNEREKHESDEQSEQQSEQ